MMERDNWLPQIVLRPPHKLFSMSVPTLTHKHTHTINYNKKIPRLCSFIAIMVTDINDDK